MKYCGSLHVTPLIRFYVDVKYILLHNSHLPCHRDILIQCQVIYVNLMRAQEITTGKKQFKYLPLIKLPTSFP